MEIDFDFAAAMIQKKRGRPPKPKNPPDTSQVSNAPSIAPSDTYIDIYNKDDIDISLLGIDDKENKDNNSSNIKGKLTKQELTFLEIYFNSKHLRGKDRFTIDSAMKSAGYGDYSQTTRYLLARKIVEKYESATPEARKIFAKLGFGPVKVALGIIDHAENAPPTVSLNALKLAAQCQGMIEQADNPNAGITINLNLGPSPSPGSPGSPPAAVVGVFGVPGEAQPQAAPPPPRKPLQITR